MKVVCTPEKKTQMNGNERELTQYLLNAVSMLVGVSNPHQHRITTGEVVGGSSLPQAAELKGDANSETNAN